MANHAALRDVKKRLKDVEQLERQITNEFPKLAEIQRKGQQTRQQLHATYQQACADINHLSRAQHHRLATQQAAEATLTRIKNVRTTLHPISARGEKATWLATTTASNWAPSDTLSLAALQEQFHQADQEIQKTIDALASLPPSLPHASTAWDDVAEFILLPEEADESREQGMPREEKPVGQTANAFDAYEHAPLQKEEA